jgi:hypothetical protein
MSEPTEMTEAASAKRFAACIRNEQMKRKNCHECHELHLSMSAMNRVSSAKRLAG